MTADSAGNDVKAVGVAVTGSLGIAPAGTTMPSSSEGKDPELVLDPAFVKLGLVKKDGGPQLAWGPDGDPIDFWQAGYSIPSGLSNVTLTVTLAEALSDQVRELYGKGVDANGYQVVDGGGIDDKFVLFTEEIFRNGAIRRRAIPIAGVQSVTEDRNTRGEVIGEATVFKIDRDQTLGGHFGEWVIPAEDES